MNGLHTRRDCLRTGLLAAGGVAASAATLAAHRGGQEAAAQEESAPAYVFVQSISVTDAEAFGRYQAMARQTITNHGGRFLARGATVEFLEGQGDMATVGLLQFPSLAAVRDWFTSAEYQDALTVRRSAGEQRIFAIEGGNSDQ